jgi:hypothetical protein
VSKDRYVRRTRSVIVATTGGSCVMPGSVYGAVPFRLFQFLSRTCAADGPRPPLAEDNGSMRIRIEGVDLPGRSCGPSNDVPDGYRNIHVGIQRRGKRDELLGPTPGDAPAARWTFECQLSGARDHRASRCWRSAPCAGLRAVCAPPHQALAGYSQDHRTETTATAKRPERGLDAPARRPTRGVTSVLISPGGG